MCSTTSIVTSGIAERTKAGAVVASWVLFVRVTVLSTMTADVEAPHGAAGHPSDSRDGSERVIRRKRSAHQDVRGCVVRPLSGILCPADVRMSHFRHKPTFHCGN
jgi:hypothetical protein